MIHWYIDETHLFSIPDDFDTIRITYDNIVIPCRPTSPDVDITLFSDGIKVSNYISWNIKFRLASFSIKHIIYCLKIILIHRIELPTTAPILTCGSKNQMYSSKNKWVAQ